MPILGENPLLEVTTEYPEGMKKPPTMFEVEYHHAKVPPAGGPLQWSASTYNVCVIAFDVNEAFQAAKPHIRARHARSDDEPGTKLYVRFVEARVLGQVTTIGDAA